MSTVISRREAIRRGVVGASGLLLADRLSLRPLSADPSARPKAKAKSVIQIWLNGGASQLDTFDPKPEAGPDYCGPLDKAIATNVPGMTINGALPLLAKQADKYSIIRSMTHGESAHEHSLWIVLTGRPKGAAASAIFYPSVGAVVSLFKGVDAGYRGKVPPYILLTDNNTRPSHQVGFLDPRYGPFATGGDPSVTPWAVDGIVIEGITDQQQRQRRELLRTLDTLGGAMKGDEELGVLAQARADAYDMMLGEGRKLFDLSTEKDALRDQYGRNKLGQACLAARKLVEAGVPYVLINDAELNKKDWDTHRDHFTYMAKWLPELDKALAALLQDLSDRGLLDSTIVWLTGEMGRGPKIDWQPPFNGGRGHWPKCFSIVVAGGGFKGGHVVGASDAKGENVKERPVYPCDVIGSIYQLLGIDLAAKLPHPQGRDAYVTPTAAENIKSSGLLKEIM